jgi:hypothetical protein
LQILEGIGWKCLAGTNDLAYFVILLVTK